MFTQAAPSTATDTATLTAAQLKVGLLTGTPTAAATYTTPTGTAFEAEFASFATDEAFEFVIINLATTTTFDITIAAGAGFTLVGNMVVAAAIAAEAAVGGISTGRFLARRTAANTFSLYRVG
jgi:hypothetical protein